MAVKTFLIVFLYKDSKYFNVIHEFCVYRIQKVYIYELITPFCKVDKDGQIHSIQLTQINGNSKFPNYDSNDICWSQFPLLNENSYNKILSFVDENLKQKPPFLQ